MLSRSTSVFHYHFAFASEDFNSGIKSCFDGAVFQNAVCEKCFSIVFDVFTFRFCYISFFIHKTVLVSLFLPCICISYPLKVFKFDTEILRDSCAVPLLKTLSFFVSDFVSHVSCNSFLFCAFVTMIYWTSTEVLLNLVVPLGSAVPFLDFEQIHVFWTFGFDFVSIVFDSLSVGRSLPELYFSYSIYLFLLLTLREIMYGSWLWFH